MASNFYECMFILDANRYARAPGNVSNLIDTKIQQAGGNVLVSRLWNESKLAYPIRGHRKGTYWLTYVEMEGVSVDKLSRQFDLDDNILRHMIIKIDPRLIDTMVAHAKGETQAAPETAPEAAAESKPETETKEVADEPAKAES